MINWIWIDRTTNVIWFLCSWPANLLQWMQNSSYNIIKKRSCCTFLLQAGFCDRNVFCYMNHGCIILPMLVLNLLSAWCRFLYSCPSRTEVASQSTLLLRYWNWFLFTLCLGRVTRANFQQGPYPSVPLYGLWTTQCLTWTSVPLWVEIHLRRRSETPVSLDV